MAINVFTAEKIVNTKGIYYTPKGNAYKAYPVYDKRGRMHGHVIYVVYPDKYGAEPIYMTFMPKRKPNVPK